MWSRLHDLFQQDTWETDVLEYIAVDNEVSFALCWIAKIGTLIGNSVTFDFSAWKRSIDFLFIDGGHDFLTVKADTENALNMVVLEKPACIMWHDTIGAGSIRH